MKFSGIFLPIREVVYYLTFSLYSIFFSLLLVLSLLFLLFHLFSLLLFISLPSTVFISLSSLVNLIAEAVNLRLFMRTVLAIISLCFFGLFLHHPFLILNLLKDFRHVVLKIFVVCLFFPFLISLFFPFIISLFFA